jgi:hypothetical protein
VGKELTNLCCEKDQHITQCYAGYHIMRHVTDKKHQIGNMEYQSVAQARFTENSGKETGKE